MKNKNWLMNEENRKLFDKCFGIEHIKSEENCIKYQRAEYIEDGEYIQVHSDRFELWHIPQYGGEESLLFSHIELDKLMDYYKTL